MSPADNLVLIQRLNDFLSDPKNARVVVIKTGKNGESAYQINFAPCASDIERLERNIASRSTWSAAKINQHRNTWAHALQSRISNDLKRKIFTYTNLSHGGSPSRILSLVHFNDNLDLKRRVMNLRGKFPAASEKDLEIAMKPAHQGGWGLTLAQVESMGVFNEDAVRSRKNSTQIKINPSRFKRTKTPAWLWIHRSGYRLLSGHAATLCEKNFQKCITGSGDLDVLYETGKGIKYIRFSENLKAKNQIAKILGTPEDSSVVNDHYSESVYYFEQGSLEWSRSQPGKNWRAIIRVDLNDYPHLKAHHAIYSKYQYVESYAIEKILREAGTPDLTAEDTNFGKRFKEELKKKIAELKVRMGITERDPTLPPSLRPTHVYFRNICDLVDRDDLSGLELLNEIKQNILIGPISQMPLVDPVITKCGHTFERAQINQWLRRKLECVICRQRVSHSSISPDLITRELLRFITVRLSPAPL